MKRYFVLALIALVMGGAVLSRAEVRSRQEPGISYTGLSGDAKPTLLVKPGDRFYETDTNLVFIYNGATWAVIGATVESLADTLLASATNGIAVATAGFDEIMLGVICEGTDVDCSFRLQGKLSGIGWKTVDNLADTTLVQTDYGSKYITYRYPALFDSMRAQAVHVSASDSVITKLIRRKAWPALP